MPAQPNIRCRQIEPGDLDGIVELLARGFPTRSAEDWRRGLDRHAERSLPAGVPRFGYLLESGRRPVGVLLILASSATIGGKTTTTCNVSSWYVEPDYRSFAPMLMSVAVRLKNVTYINISAAEHTWPIIEAFGFAPYCDGQFTAFPFLARSVRGVRVMEVRPPSGVSRPPTLPDHDLLVTHAGYGCLSLVCSAPDGNYPFVFQPFRRWHGRLPGLRLIYCRNIGDFARMAGPLGRYLLRRGMPWVALDAAGPIKGVPGVYRKNWERKYFKGPDQPRIGDLAYTELALFGP
jgi:hypothetical protein